MSDIMGNDEVLSLLEFCINEAKTKKVDYATVMMHEAPNLLSGGRAGLAEIEPIMAEALRQAAEQLDKDVKKRAKPPTDPNLDASYVCYNMAANAASFDFTTWLLVAEMRRRKANAPAPLKVHFWRGAENNLGLDEPKRIQFFNNVIRPAVPLLGATEEGSLPAGDEQLLNNAGDIIDLYHEGVEVPYYKPTEQDLARVKDWLKGIDNIVTITLRETDTWAFRNSNVDAWCKFADYLRTQGYNPVLVRDTAVAESKLDGQMICPSASRDLGFRIALYSIAKANCLISNGPASLIYIAPWPYLLFVNPLPDDHWYYPNTISNWRDKMKVPPGTQYPWAKDNQRIFWGEDTYENILEGWNQIAPALN